MPDASERCVPLDEVTETAPLSCSPAAADTGESALRDKAPLHDASTSHGFQMGSAYHAETEASSPPPLHAGDAAAPMNLRWVPHVISWLDHHSGMIFNVFALLLVLATILVEALINLPKYKSYYSKSPCADGPSPLVRTALYCIVLASTLHWHCQMVTNQGVSLIYGRCIQHSDVAVMYGRFPAAADRVSVNDQRLFHYCPCAVDLFHIPCLHGGLEDRSPRCGLPRGLHSYPPGTVPDSHRRSTGQ